MYVRDMLHQLLYLLQLHCCRVVLQYVSDSLDIFLQAANQFFIGRRHPTALELCYLAFQPPRLIGQLTDHGIPDCKALVAGFAGREGTLVAPGTLIAAWAGHALHTGALARPTVALLAGDSLGVAVTGWEHSEDSEGEAHQQESKNLGTDLQASEVHTPKNKISFTNTSTFAIFFVTVV